MSVIKVRFSIMKLVEGYEVWFEDVRSIYAKLQLAAEKDIHGVGYWNLMRPFRANWLLVNQMLH